MVSTEVRIVYNVASTFNMITASWQDPEAHRTWRFLALLLTQWQSARRQTAQASARLLGLRTLGHNRRSYVRRSTDCLSAIQPQWLLLAYRSYAVVLRLENSSVPPGVGLTAEHQDAFKVVLQTVEYLSSWISCSYPR